MTRNNADFRNQILFHGTPAVLKPGDIINPGADGLAFGTMSLEQAHMFGASKAYSQSNLQDNTHHVYQVEPIGDVEVKYADSDNPYFGSRKGMRVVKKVEDD